MLHRTVLVLAILAASLFSASSAFASTKCLCNDGMVVQSMEDDGDDDDCNDACDEFGGGKVWVPQDAEFEGGAEGEVNRRPLRHDEPGPGAIER
jgi:hypothetical protein